MTWKVMVPTSRFPVVPQSPAHDPTSSTSSTGSLVVHSQSDSQSDFHVQGSVKEHHHLPRHHGLEGRRLDPHVVVNGRPGLREAKGRVEAVAEVHVVHTFGSRLANSGTTSERP